MKRRQSRQNHSRQNTVSLLVGGGLLILMGLLIQWRGVLQSKAEIDHCQEMVQPKTVLSRQQLTQLISVTENTSQESIKAIANVPYCKLSSIKLATGAIAERDAYPLAFDPDTWLIILYEGNQYAGYDFSFRH
jgi:hypothetical protein